jgi:hypothetical protein
MESRIIGVFFRKGRQEMRDTLLRQSAGVDGGMSFSGEGVRIENNERVLRPSFSE